MQQHEQTHERSVRLRRGMIAVFPEGHYYCGACGLVLPYEQLDRHEPRRHPIVPVPYCETCRSNGAAEVSCIEWERDIYKGELRATRAKLRRLQQKNAARPVELAA